MPTSNYPKRAIARLFALVASTVVLTAIAAPAHAAATLPEAGANVGWIVVAVVVLLGLGVVLMLLRRRGQSKADDGGAGASGDGGAGGD